MSEKFTAITPSHPPAAAMIIRSLAVRSGVYTSNCIPRVAPLTPPGRQALAPRSLQPLRRFLSSDVQSSTENSIKQLHSLETQLNAHLDQPVPSTDAAAQAAPAAQVAATVAEQYHLHKQQRESILPPHAP